MGRLGLPEPNGDHPRERTERIGLHGSPKDIVDEVEKAKNRNKAQVRAKVEHVYGEIKGVLGFSKVRYRGLAKNLTRLEAACVLAYLFMLRRQ